jgi:hypothetical protein
MTKTRWAVLGLVLVLLVSVQHYGLEVQPETLTEAPMKRVAGLPASDVLPTYIASLFFGAFRAVAVDILWIQLRKVEEEKRWYERREIIKLISYVQPRNPEVWSHMGWHSAYNVANGFTDKEKSWEWVKFGLLWLRKGITTLPNEPYLKDQLAYTLWHKPSWRDGSLDMDLLKRIEGDAELQAALLPDGMKSDRPLSAFELALPWLERASEELMTRDYQLTQMGLYLYPDSMDGFARGCMILQGMYEWKKDRREEAKEWFRRAQRQCELMVARSPDAAGGRRDPLKYRHPISSIFADWAKMYARYPDLVDLEFKARSKRPEDELAYLELLQSLLVQYGPIDEQWFWNRYDPHAVLNALKMRIVKGEDVQECNDTFDMATEINPGDLSLANLAPPGLDVDFYRIKVEPPAEVNPAPLAPPRPVTVKLIFTRPPTAKLDLKVTFLDPNRRPMKEMLVRSGGTVDLKVPAYARYYLKVEAASPPPWPDDTRYGLQYAVEH